MPVTSKVQDELLEVSPHRHGEAQREAFISQTISTFWQAVFGWNESRKRPSLEDHFTQIDLAANSGHYLGRTYGPKKLRALRRMTIHRVFTLIDVEPRIPPHIDALIRQLTTTFQVTVVTTNWDIMVERCLEREGRSVLYSRQPDLRAPEPAPTGLPVWKLHGSGNWGYCEVCRCLTTGEIRLGKIALHFGWLLEPEDFNVFGAGEEVLRELGTAFRECLSCGGRLAARVATFSYRKNLDVPFFHSIWEEARDSLRQADRWLFVG